MYGAIIGDIVGSVYEFHNVKKKDIPIKLNLMRFTDDSVLTIATMDALLHPEVGYVKMYKQYFRDYVLSHRGFGGRFYEWGLKDSLKPYNSYGNGSAMRVSPVGWLYNSLEETLEEAKRSAEVTHNHPEGIKGAQAIAMAIYLARKNTPKEEMRSQLALRFNYDLSRSIESIRKVNTFDETCQGSVPEALTCFLNSTSFEDTLRTAISIGGDSDTIACMACSIAEAYYGIDAEWIEFANSKIDGRMRSVLQQFYVYVESKLKKSA